MVRNRTASPHKSPDNSESEDSPSSPEAAWSPWAEESRLENELLLDEENERERERCMRWRGAHVPSSGCTPPSSEDSGPPTPGGYYYFDEGAVLSPPSPGSIAHEALAECHADLDRQLAAIQAEQARPVLCEWCGGNLRDSQGEVIASEDARGRQFHSDPVQPDAAHTG